MKNGNNLFKFHGSENAIIDYIMVSVQDLSMFIIFEF